MVSFPNSKINIGLYVTAKRNDGYHDINSLFFPLPIYDVLEVVDSQPGDNGFIFSQSGKPIPGDEKHNLCIKAYLLLRKAYPKLPVIKIHLHKNIPMGGGLGGGSSDGAGMLTLLNNKYGLNLDPETIMQISLSLGSDCPFFIQNNPSIASGRGEVLHPFSMDLSHYKILVINPGIEISTQWAFSQVVPKTGPDLASLLVKPIESWKENIHNDFEEAVFREHPSIGEIKKRLYDNGAVYASMSGSGSSVYGIFKKSVALSFPQGWFYKWVETPTFAVSKQ